ncbi:hypothetical protein LOAG_17818 [Loa loa]|uniref:Uncharacterized protein n=1 Tax=Loa loa TaxID=7209 RepID=A0A1S0UGV9_LOALO|nr:hypothetical protein LOAG_17818 [Loa loa]EJD74940.1 hypothetical protein LOAG_17818 [Loa loa]
MKVLKVLAISLFALLQNIHSIITANSQIDKLTRNSFSRICTLDSRLPVATNVVAAIF